MVIGCRGLQNNIMLPYKRYIHTCCCDDCVFLAPTLFENPRPTLITSYNLLYPRSDIPKSTSYVTGDMQFV